ncbi:hypothetical protein [Dyadobacter sp. 32]|uniref:hypothetical protein n=1 Tax=Dyadobacter sp. 32 TaxID=538966 RepID=UPI0011EC5714
MKTLILIMGLLAWIGSCSDDMEVTESAILETDATWTNMLATDGCSWHFAVNKKDTSFSLLPDDASLAKIEKALGKLEGAYSFTDVRLKYSVTGRKKDVLCGWGHTARYDEITVVEIARK